MNGMLIKQEYRGGFPVDLVRNTWDGDSLSPEEVRGKIAVATTTLYKDIQGSESDRLRSDLAYETFRRLRENEYEVVVADGGSSDDFLGRIRELGVILERERGGGMGVGRRQVMRRAYETGKPVIVWTEPEKYPLVDDYPVMASPLLRGGANSIVPFRTWEGLESYPETQRFEELFVNLTYAKAIGFYLDVTMGPKFWERGATEFYLDEFDRLRRRLDLPDLWDSTIIPSVLIAHTPGLKIGDVDSSYRHPREQTELEEGNIPFDHKRADQAEKLTRALKEVLKHLGKAA